MVPHPPNIVFSAVQMNSDWMMQLGSAHEWAGGTNRSLEQGGMSKHTVWQQARSGSGVTPTKYNVCSVVHLSIVWISPVGSAQTSGGGYTEMVL